MRANFHIPHDGGSYSRKRLNNEHGPMKYHDDSFGEGDDFSGDGIKEKIEEYSKFIENTLYPNLQVAVAARERVEEEIGEYRELHSQIQSFVDNDNPPEEAMVDLGHKIAYCRAIVSNPKRIFVSVGLGFHVEMDLKEACTFIEKRIHILETKILPPKVEEARVVASHVENAIVILDELAKEIL